VYAFSNKNGFTSVLALVFDVLFEKKKSAQSFVLHGKTSRIEYRKSIGPQLILRAIDFMRNVNCESPDDVFHEKTGRHFCDLWRGFFGSQQSLVTFYASRF
jgi:hypothetical protein